MEPDSTNDKAFHIQQMKRQNSFQNLSPTFQSSSNTFENQIIQRKVDLQLFLHFQHILSQTKYHHRKQLKFNNQIVSKQSTFNQTIKYLNSFEESIKPLPPDHNEQLLFLIQIGNKHNRLITDWYCIYQAYNNPTCPAKYFLGFSLIEQRINLKQFLSFNNWNHLVMLSFAYCYLYNDYDWKALVENADNFKNLKKLNLCGNIIRTIKQGEIDQFKFLSEIDLRGNPLSGQTKKLLYRLIKTNRQRRIYLDK